jgi:sulfatase maturation enzyme AslB (radical SAM superfamily)
MSLNREKIFNSLANKKVLIWGARMTGIGALRQLNKKNITVLNFIDSDDALVGKFVHGLKVYHPNQLSELVKNRKDVAILIAVSIKENEILNQLQKLNIVNVPIVSFFDAMAPYYTIDILGSCNLKCPSCPHSIIGTEVPKGSMNIKTFKSVFDKIITDTPSISHVSLYSWGEPFLHPYLDQIIDYVHEKNVAVALSSNLSIKFGDRIEKIIKSNPDYLKVSLSGF